MNLEPRPFPAQADSLDRVLGARPAAETMATRVLPVIEEVLQVAKRRVDRGGWRVTKRVASHEQAIDELLHDRKVLIERRPIGRTLDGTTLPVQRYEGDVLVLPVVKEVLVTEKRLVLVEEIRITQVTASRRETQQVHLRNEEISIERLDPETLPDPGLESTAGR